MAITTSVFINERASVAAQGSIASSIAYFNRMGVRNKPGTSRNTITGVVTCNIHIFTGTSWRLVHDGVRVVDLVDGQANNRTSTIEDGRAEFPTEAEADAEIRNLGLIPLPED